MIKYSEEEITFILNSTPEKRTSKPPLRDLRQLGCPDSVFEIQLDRQVAQIGNKLTEYRSRNTGHTGTVSRKVKPDHETATIKLF